MNVSTESVMELEAVVARHEQTYGSVNQTEMSDECDCKDAGCGRSCTDTCEGRCEGGCETTCEGSGNR